MAIFYGNDNRGYSDSSALTLLQGHATVGMGNQQTVQALNQMAGIAPMQDRNAQLFNMGAINMIGGIGSTLLGGFSAASSYRAGGQISMNTARYNAELLQLESEKEVDNLGLRLSKFMSTQRTQIAESGMGMGSRSALELMNETFSAFERQALDIRNTSKQRQAMTIYEGQLAQWRAEAQARQAIGGAIGSAIGGLAKLF
jgi:hypothetical protein